MLDRVPHVRVEHLDRVGGDGAGRVVVPARQREEIGEREAGFEEPQPGAQHVGVGLGVARRAVALLRDDQTLACDRVEQRRGHADARRELVEREQLGVAGLRAGDRGGERHVGGVELAGDEAADHRQREALALELLDPLRAARRGRRRTRRCAPPGGAAGSSWRFW